MDSETGNQLRSLALTSNPTFDCNPGCRSKQHAAQLISSITKGSDLQLRLFLLRCHNAGSIADEFGRTSLHMAASCGRDDVVEWLIAEQGASVAAADHESRWTALHRAVFYGQLSAARLLIAHGSSLQQRDREGLTPLDIVMKDRLPHVEFLHTGLDELFTWGANSTFTLGHENMQPRKLPEQVESFRRHAISIKKVTMSKYHSAFLNDSGQVYTCGHGLGGRLGHGDEQTYLVPKSIDVLKTEVCVDVAAAINHTIMLMENGTVYSCGLNNYHQLGQFPPPEKVLSPKPVNSKSLKGRHIIGVCAQRFHTVLYTVDTVFTCGLNAGQLGHYKVGGESLVSQPRPVAALCHKDTHIQQVAASDAATVIVTSKGDVYALHEYQCRKIVSKWLDIAEVHCSGGHLDHSTDSESLNEHGGAPLTVVILTTTGKVFVCHASSDCVARRCVFAIGRPIFATHLALGANVLALVTKDGEAFTGIIPKYSQPLSSTTRVVTPGKDVQHFDTFSLTLSDLVLKDDVIEVSLERVPLVHRATAVSTDQQGTNISVLQSHPNASITCIPSVRQSEMKFHMSGLLSDAHHDDSVHDVILQVGLERFPLHRYILAQRSEFFRRQFTPTLEDSCSRSDGVSLPDHPTTTTTLKIDLRGRPISLFKQLLQFIYTDSCDFVCPGHRIQTDETTTSGSTKNSAPGSEVTAAGGRKGKKSKKKSKEMNGGHLKEVSSPDGVKNDQMVETLKELAKEFGVGALVKKLDAVQIVDGYVVNARGRSMPSSSLRFERKSSDLSDVCIEGGDGATIACHKCILVARLEYFRSMFSSSWIEMTNNTTLRLPFPADVLRIVIDYLYTDRCSVFDGRCNTELVCSVLVAADQLLIVRLRDECEAALAQQLNLRNVCELLEFANVYNATQLVVTCHQFITINLAALLETRSLDLLSDDVIDKLTEYYKENVVGMNRRRITPYSSWPDFELLEQLEKSVMEGSPSRPGGTVATPGSGKKTGVPRRRTRTKSTEGSVEHVKHLQKQVSTEELASKEKDLMDARIEEEAAAEASTTIILPLLDIAPLAAAKSSTVSKSPTVTTAKSLSAEGPQMISVPEKHCSLLDIISEEMARTVHSSQVLNDQQTSAASSSRWPKKMSQKERKRLSVVAEKSVDIISVQTGEKNEGNVSTASAEVIAGISANPWKTVDNVVQSFKDLMLTEKKTAQEKVSISQAPYSISKPTTTAHPSTTSTNNDSNRLSWGILPGSSSSSSLQLTPVTPSSEPASPTESPWHLPAAKVSDAGKSQLASRALSAARFSDIVEDEMTQVQTLRRTTNKSLSLIQIEEQAMSELLSFYGASDNVHQYITVERVPSTNAQPLWAATQRQFYRPT